MPEGPPIPPPPPPLLDYPTPETNRRPRNRTATVAGILAACTGLSILTCCCVIPTGFGHRLLDKLPWLIAFTAFASLVTGIVGLIQSRQPYDPGRTASLWGIWAGAIALASLLGFLALLSILSHQLP